MLKKTTVYLTEDDKLLLKKLAATKQMSLSEALRYSIRKACRPSSKQEKEFWSTLEKIWDQNRSIDPAKIEADVNDALDEVRYGKSKRRSS